MLHGSRRVRSWLIDDVRQDMTSATATLRFRIVMTTFIVGLLVSGITAFPLLAEMRLLVKWIGIADAISPAGYTGLEFWVLTVRFGLEDMYAHYPWIAYGTDWLAFGHITIALFFVGVLMRPGESRSVLYAGIAACLLVVPLAFVCGVARGIPFYWRLIDCSFGVFGAIPLLYCLRLLRHLAPQKPNQPQEPSRPSGPSGTS
jgi:hypothetical protein